MTTFFEAPSKKVVAIPTNITVPVSTRHILLVDDDIHLLEFNAKVLTSSGYTVDTAKDGAEAWKALHDINYNLLITDNKMPKVTGFELIKKVRSEGITLPIILVSGTMPTEELERQPSSLRPAARGS